MVAVLVEADLRGVEPDAALTELREQIVPAFKSLPGFESGTWLRANGGEKSLSLTLWDTETHAQAMIHQFGMGSNHFMSAAIVRAEVHEVAATA
jgi:heme-degrading monooxygenase HmoA